ncbi:MAG: helix-turn-helix transcriptional regulator [Gemmatimonadetes bacterium]|nr:helix-turn-helix transcriptional regulator [Gemmatimonadota bacterium]MDA1103360.1 helix-turn-helix transcriptional regulator [Gemmatimonadota bacterium]
MGGRDYLGEFELVVLLALARLGDDAYGASIHREILDATGRDVSIPAVYVTLKRMERKALVSSRVGTGNAPGRRTTRDYRLLAEGEAAIDRSRALLEGLWQGLSSPLAEGGG